MVTRLGSQQTDVYKWLLLMFRGLSPKTVVVGVGHKFVCGYNLCNWNKTTVVQSPRVKAKLKSSLTARIRDNGSYSKSGSLHLKKTHAKSKNTRSLLL